MVRVQWLLKYLLKKKNAHLSLVRTFKHGLRGELQAERKNGEERGESEGGREGEDGRGSGNSLLRWVANYCPFWMARSPALAKGTKHTHTHTLIFKSTSGSVLSAEKQRAGIWALEADVRWPYSSLINEPLSHNTNFFIILEWLNWISWRSRWSWQGDGY